MATVPKSAQSTRASLVARALKEYSIDGWHPFERGAGNVLGSIANLAQALAGAFADASDLEGRNGTSLLVLDQTATAGAFQAISQLAALGLYFTEEARS